MLTNRVICLRNVSIPKQIMSQVYYFSSKPPNQPVIINVDGERKKVKRQSIPKITLLSSEDDISVTTMEEAQNISKRRDLKLVKLIDLDSKTQRPVYKLMTGAQYHEEDLKQRENKKFNKQSDNSLKGEKLLMINAGISKHDLEINVNKILKWITKKNEVRVTVNGNSSEKLESVYKFLEENLNTQGRFLQKRVKGNDLKFQIVPVREVKTSSDGKTS